MVPSPLRQDRPATLARSRPSATSLIVKSNSLRATKSIAGEASRLFSGSTATLAPIRPILRLGIERLERLGGAHVGGKRRRRGVHDHEVAARRLGRDVLEPEPVRRRVDQLRAFDQRGRLGEPGRVPERAHLAPHLVARAGAAVVAVKGRRLQEKRLHHAGRTPRSDCCMSFCCMSLDNSGVQISCRFTPRGTTICDMPAQAKLVLECVLTHFLVGVVYFGVTKARHPEVGTRMRSGSAGVIRISLGEAHRRGPLRRYS